MGKPPRKYFSETSLSLFTARCVAIPPEELLSGREIPEGAKDTIDVCHIYLICQRPRLSFKPDTFDFGKPLSKGHLVRTVEGKREEFPFSMALVNENGGPIGVSPYPHRELIGVDQAGRRTRQWPATFVANVANVLAPVSDFEVLYVGQSFGDGNRTAFQRLQSHKTLQRILADTHAKSPDNEIILLLFEYVEPQVMVSMDGINKDAMVQGDEDIGHVLDLLEDPPSKKEIISIAEAGLIWYFKPAYNKMLKEAKPSTELKLLQSCYKYDMAGLTVEINSEELQCRLWSAERGPGYHHIAQFDLHDPALRRSFFSITDDKGELTLIDSSGPIF